jgi:hypothetical protein
MHPIIVLNSIDPFRSHCVFASFMILVVDDQVQNAIALDTLYMTGAVMED